MKIKSKNSLRKSENKTVFAIVGTTLLSLYSLTLLFALFWATYSSVKDRFDFFFSPLAFPESFHFENFSTVFKKLYISIAWGRGSRRVYVPEMFMWSIVYALGTSIVAQFSRCCCAYVCAKFSKYRPARILYNVVIIVMILPIVGNLASTMQVYRKLMIYDNMFVYFLSAVGFTGQYFLIYYAAFKSVSWEYAEAAFIDGAGHFQIGDVAGDEAQIRAAGAQHGDKRDGLHDAHSPVHGGSGDQTYDQRIPVRGGAENDRYGDGEQKQQDHHADVPQASVTMDGIDVTHLLFHKSDLLNPAMR